MTLNNEIVTYFENLVSYLDLIAERPGDEVKEEDIERLVLSPIRMKLKDTYRKRMTV